MIWKDLPAMGGLFECIRFRKISPHLVKCLRLIIRYRKPTYEQVQALRDSVAVEVSDLRRLCTSGSIQTKGLFITVCSVEEGWVVM